MQKIDHSWNVYQENLTEKPCFENFNKEDIEVLYSYEKTIFRSFLENPRIYIQIEIRRFTVILYIVNENLDLLETLIHRNNTWLSEDDIEIVIRTVRILIPALFCFCVWSKVKKNSYYKLIEKEIDIKSESLAMFKKFSKTSDKKISKQVSVFLMKNIRYEQMNA